MEKNLVLRLFKLGNFASGILLTCIGLTMYLTGTGTTQGFMGLGMIIGTWIGVAIGHLYRIPKFYNSADERELIIKVLAVCLSLSLGFLSIFICFTLSAFNVIQFSNNTYLYTTLGICLVVLMIQELGSKVLSRIM